MRKIEVSEDAGKIERWGEVLVLREPAESLVVDLTELEYPGPFFLARLRGLIDWHSSTGQDVHVISPRRPAVRSYLEHMHLVKDLPASCSCDLATLEPETRSKVLIPIRRLCSREESDRLEEELSELYLAHFSGPIGKLADAFTTTVSEISDNATTHGKSSVGTSYVVAQRYQQDRCVLAIGDLGVGIPVHIRGAFPDLTDDGDAIREATKEGMSGTGDSMRGYGYQHVIDSLKETRVPYGELRVWSGKGRFRVQTRDGLQERRRAWTVDHATAGTWVQLDLIGR